MAREVDRPGPDPHRLEVDPGDDELAGVETSIERQTSLDAAAGLVHVGLDAEPIEGLAGPAGDPRVLPLIPERHHQDRPAVDLAAVLGLEFPEDVARAKAAADAEDRGLRQRLARQTRDDALVRQDVGQRGRLRVQAAAHPIARRGGGVGRRRRWWAVVGVLDQGPPGGGVSLTGLGHARTHDSLEGLVGGHRSVSVTAVDARAHTATSPAGRMVDRFVPRIRIPFTAASPRRVGARSGSRARERAVASVRPQGTVGKPWAIGRTVDGRAENGGGTMDWWRWGRVELPVQDPSTETTTSVSDDLSSTARTGIGTLPGGPVTCP